MIIPDDSVAVRFTARGTHLGPWLQFAATRQGIEYTGVTLAHITAGRITWHHTCWDKAGLMTQIQRLMAS